MKFTQLKALISIIKFFPAVLAQYFEEITDVLISLIFTFCFYYRRLLKGKITYNLNNRYILYIN